jgi:hypothetical protein
MQQQEKTSVRKASFEVLCRRCKKTYPVTLDKVIFKSNRGEKYAIKCPYCNCIKTLDKNKVLQL